MKICLMFCLLFLTMSIGCQKNSDNSASNIAPKNTAPPKDTTPHKCAACDGTGKVKRSEEIPLPFRITSFKVNDHGFINPDYFADAVIENMGDEDGTFTIGVDFIYKDIGTHTEQADLFVKAHSTATKQIHYDADKRYDDAKCKARGPSIIHTTESICPVCKGKGLVVN
jgi:hypothetical protein